MRSTSNLRMTKNWKSIVKEDTIYHSLNYPGSVIQVKIYPEIIQKKGTEPKTQSDLNDFRTKYTVKIGGHVFIKDAVMLYATTEEQITNDFDKRLKSSIELRKRLETLLKKK